MEVYMKNSLQKTKSYILSFIFFCFSLLINSNLYSQIIITEIMKDPAVVSDENGEWFEIYNTSGSSVDINGWFILDGVDDFHTINNGGALNVPAGGFLVLGSNIDFGTNDGVNVDYEYNYSEFSLNSADDDIVLFDGFSVIDIVEYDDGVTFPDPTGASMILTNFTFDNNVGTSWSVSTEAYSPNNFGTPGSLGSEAALPVELFSFTGSATANGVQLNWVTASETDNDGFILLRDGEVIASHTNTNELDGQGTKSGKTAYKYLDQSVELGTYTYTLRSEDISGLIHDYDFSVNVEVKELGDGSPDEISYALSQNYPNPFNPTTNIAFEMKKAGRATIQVYDMLGRMVKQLSVDAQKGNNVTNFNGSNLTSGMYFYQMTAEGFTSQMKRMILVK